MTFQNIAKQMLLYTFYPTIEKCYKSVMCLLGRVWERIFPLKMMVLGTKILKICVLRTEILATWKQGWKCRIFLNIEKIMGHGRRIEGKLVG